MRSTFSKIALLAVIVALSVGFYMQQASSQNNTKSSIDLTGAWRSSIQFPSGIMASFKGLEFMLVMNQGGTMTESSNYDGVPPMPPAYGIWRKTGDRQYELHYEFYMTAAPDSLQSLLTGGGFPPAGRGIFRENITLSADGDSFTSTIKFEAFDLTGKSMEAASTGTGKAVRMKF